MIIRRAKIKDAQRIAELGLALGKYHERLDPYFSRAKNAKATYTKWFRRCIRSNNRLLVVAEDNGVIVGYALATIKKRPPVMVLKRVGYLSDMYIIPEFRHRGVGKLLLRTLVAWFRKQRLTHIELMAHTKNSIGVPAWRKYGFKEMTYEMRKKI